MSTVVSEGTYIIVSAILDLFDRLRRRRLRRSFFERTEKTEKARTPPPYYLGFVRDGDRAKIVGKHTKLVVDAPYYGQTQYEIGKEMKIYTPVVEVASPEWFNTLKFLYQRAKEARKR